MAARKSTKRSRKSPAAPRAPESAHRRVSRQALDRERIELAALELVEKDGLAEFSMRKLGAALGVEAMSLYHHFPSKGHLLDALLDRLMATTVPPETSRPWRERARVFCLAYRELAFRHPEFARYMILHRMNTRGSLAWLEGVVKIFTDAGFETELAARAFRSMGYYLMGCVLDETAGYAKGPSAAEPVPAAEQAKIAPTVMKLGAYFAREHWDRTFLVGLELLLDGFERQLAAQDVAERL
jgi:AcrR family transcriptional regulator